jgi:hypothetical protein
MPETRLAQVRLAGRCRDTGEYPWAGGSQRKPIQDTSARVEFPKTLHVDFFDSTLQIESRLDALFAIYYESRNIIFIRDSVRVYNTKGDTLFCKELNWDQAQGKFYTDKPVRIHTPEMIMYGEGLSAPQDFKTFDIFKVTNSVMRVKQ